MPHTLTEAWHLFNNGGPHWGDETLLLLRVTVGLFFAIAGYHKIFNAERHATFVETLKRCGVWPVWFHQWFVAWVEFLGGLAVALGILTQLALLGLLAILIVALLTSELKHVTKTKLLDVADYCGVTLGLPAAIYSIVVIGLLMSGPGKYTLYALAVSYGIP